MRRVIAHCDIDAFYASVELLRRPELRGQPVIVAGNGPRSVVTTASYEARKYGIDSAMPAARARALCPHGVFVTPDFQAYTETSRRVWDLVRAHFDHVQQAGIDEGYVDVTDVEKPLKALRAMVAAVEEETGMVISVGVGPSRLVAKTISAAFKPKAFVAMSREDACRHFANASTRVLQGIGPKTADKLAELGVQTVADLQAHDEVQLVERFGERWGRYLKSRAHFHDESRVETVRVAKSRSNETTFPEDIADHAELEAVITRLAEGLCGHLRKKDARGRNIAIKVRLDDWTTVTRARTIDERTNDPEVVTAVALELFRAYAPKRPVRLLGVRVAAFDDSAPSPPSEPGQLALPL